MPRQLPTGTEMPDLLEDVQYRQEKRSGTSSYSSPRPNSPGIFMRLSRSPSAAQGLSSVRRIRQWVAALSRIVTPGKCDADQHQRQGGKKAAKGERCGIPQRSRATLQTYRYG